MPLEHHDGTLQLDKLHFDALQDDELCRCGQRPNKPLPLPQYRDNGLYLDGNPMY
jgi:hypothetical protein